MDNKLHRKDAIGALLDEYQRAINDLVSVLETISDAELVIVFDPDAADDNCRSVQTILSHVVHSGFGYATSIHNLKGPMQVRPARTFHNTIKEYINDISAIVPYTEKILAAYNDDELEQPNYDTLNIKSGWGVTYTIEQMMEHAIVHILRHRRQIEKIKRLHFDMK